MNIKALLKALMLRKFNTSLLIIQLAITLGLIVNSSILSLDTADKLAVETGLDLENTLIAEFATTSGDYRDMDFARSIFNQDLAAIKQIPGVQAVTGINQLPIQDGGTNGNVIDVDEPTLAETDNSLSYVPYMITTETVGETWGLELVEGRMFTDADKQSSDNTDPDYVPNVIITESLSKALHKGQSSIGQELNTGIVIGVVKDFLISPAKAKHHQHAVFLNTLEANVDWLDTYVVKVEPGQMEYVRKQLKDTILAVEQQRHIYRVETMGERFENYYSDNQGLANLFIMLTALMLVVTAISSFAYARFHISQQTKFIGIRRALGAKKSDVILYVLAENWLLTTLGALLGLAIMVGLNIMLSQYVSLTKPSVWLSLVGIALVYIAGTVATWWPAYQTSKIPPVIATRSI